MQGLPTGAFDGEETFKIPRTTKTGPLYWEVLIPRENWANGQEFAQNNNYNIRVVEEGAKTKLKTTNRKFPQEFVV